MQQSLRKNIKNIVQPEEKYGKMLKAQQNLRKGNKSIAKPAKPSKTQGKATTTTTTEQNGAKPKEKHQKRSES